MNLKNTRILCSIDRQIKVKLGGGDAYLDPGLKNLRNGLQTFHT